LLEKCYTIVKKNVSCFLNKKETKVLETQIKFVRLFQFLYDT